MTREMVSSTVRGGWSGPRSASGLARCAAGLVAIAALAATHPGGPAGAGTPQTVVMPQRSVTEVADELMRLTTTWTEVGQKYASTLFLAFAGAYLVYALVQSILRGGSDFRGPVETLLREMLVLGIFGFLVNTGPQIAKQIIDSLHAVGKELAGAQQDIGPQTILNEMVAIAFPGKGTFAFTLFELQGAALLLTLAVTYCLAGMILITEIEGYIVLGGGAIVLGCGGAMWTRYLAIGYFKFAAGAGIRLLFIEAVQGIVLRFVLSWKTQVYLDGEISPELVLTMFGSVIALLILIVRIPAYVSQIQSGVSAAGAEMMLGRLPMTALGAATSIGAAQVLRGMGARGASAASGLGASVPPTSPLFGGGATGGGGSASSAAAAPSAGSAGEARGSAAAAGGSARAAPAPAASTSSAESPGSHAGTSHGPGSQDAPERPDQQPEPPAPSSSGSGASEGTSSASGPARALHERARASGGGTEAADAARPSANGHATASSCARSARAGAVAPAGDAGGRAASTQSSGAGASAASTSAASARSSSASAAPASRAAAGDATSSGARSASASALPPSYVGSAARASSAGSHSAVLTSARASTAAPSEPFRSSAAAPASSSSQMSASAPASSAPVPASTSARGRGAPNPPLDVPPGRVGPTSVQNALRRKDSDRE